MSLMIFCSWLMSIAVEKPDAKVIYIYGRGSPFEQSINRYMSSYDKGLDPNNPNSIHLNAAGLNISVTGRGFDSRSGLRVISG